MTLSLAITEYKTIRTCKQLYQTISIDFYVPLSLSVSHRVQWVRRGPSKAMLTYMQARMPFSPQAHFLAVIRLNLTSQQAALYIATHPTLRGAYKSIGEVSYGFL